MNFFRKLFGYRSKLAASSSLSYPEALDLASLCCERLRNDGRDVLLMAVTNTNSMLPTFDANAVLLLEKCGFAALREGDIVTYRANFNNELHVHRLNERRGEGWWPLGDGNGTMDPELVTLVNFDRRVCGIIYGAKSADTDR